MNPILLNKQLKENMNDLTEYRKDLESWGEEMKLKEQTSRSDRSKKVKFQTPAETKKKPQVQAAPKTRATDYSKWEKYDADLECELLEHDCEEDSELSDEVENSAWDQAITLKEKGNVHVKSKEWDRAINCYTKAINLYSYDPVFYANRALCYLKKNSFIAAEEDSTLSLRLDGTYVKALLRRAAAREGLGKALQAAEDWLSVLQLEPKNKEATLALKKNRQKRGLSTTDSQLSEEMRVSQFAASRNKTLQSKPTVAIKQTNTAKAEKDITKKVDTSDWPDPGCEIIPVKAINKPPHLRSEKPLKRIKVLEINSLSSPSVKIEERSDEASSAVKKHVIEHIQPDFKGAGEPMKPISAFQKSRKQAKDTAWPRNNAEASSILRSDDLVIVEKKAQENNIKGVENGCKEPKKTSQSEKEIVLPKSSVQFNVAWQREKDLCEKYKYLKLIGSQTFRTVFTESLLESGTFSEILKVLSINFIAKEDNVYDFLLALSQVKRFATLVMLMDSADKECLSKLDTYLREKNVTPIKEVDDLMRKYCM
ncbi:hypothetical protein HUJ04_004473 [Dendroctonus ponderosae]|uniref:RNA polymerase II-associated protein 3 n=2 Tax=Dendroctonus ponderosae TaxID=77166 RepID=A0AAR5PB63_DENPD|nr:hypothetical protein HUJ04_004473 [Dendroctonus ponderosae]